ncbi:glutaredoxin 2 isoform X2 [Eretmochelys imbricata]
MALWGALRAAGSRLRMGNNPSTSMGLSNAATVNKIQETISDNCVVIFSKTTCTYCKMAKKLFQDMNVNYTAIELDMYENGSQFQDILHQMTGGRTERSSNELLPVSKHLTRLGKGCLNPLFTGDRICFSSPGRANNYTPFSKYKIKITVSGSRQIFAHTKMQSHGFV